jgi:hypothetical protein
MWALALVACGTGDVRPPRAAQAVDVPVRHDEPTAKPAPSASVAPEETPASETPARAATHWIARSEVSAAHGGLDLTEATPVIAAATEALGAACRRHVGPEGGRASYGLTVEPNGKISQAQALDDGDAPWVHCVTAELRRLTFAARERPSSVAIAIHWARPGEEARVRNQDDVMRVIASHRMDLRKTCDSSVPAGESHVMMRFTVLPNGTVDVPGPPVTTVPKLGECVAKLVASWTFSVADEPTSVELPFVFHK